MPNRATVTPYIVAPGYHTIYLQTFRTAGQDLRNVNFQTPTDDVYRALTSLLNVPLDANGDVAQCAVVSTFNTRNVRDLDYKGFRAYGAHGVAGATGHAPAAAAADLLQRAGHPRPRPARLLRRRRRRVGRRARGDLPDRRAGAGHGLRFVHRDLRAGPRDQCQPALGPVPALPRQPGEDPRALERHAAGVGDRQPAAAAVHPARDLRGLGLPFTARVMRARGSSATVLRNTRFGAGQVLDVAAFSHAYNAAVGRYRITGSGTPRGRTMCIPDGMNRPQARCRTG